MRRRCASTGGNCMIKLPRARRPCHDIPSRDQIELIAPHREATPHALEHFAALAVILGGAFVGLLPRALVLVAGIGIEMLARSLLDLQFVNANAGGFEGGAELAEAVAEEAGGFVVGGLEGGGDDAIADIDLDIERAELGRIHADVHGATVGEQFAVDGAHDLGVIGLDEGLFGGKGRRCRGLLDFLLRDVRLGKGEFEFGEIDFWFVGGCGIVFGGNRGFVGQLLGELHGFGVRFDFS